MEKRSRQNQEYTILGTENYSGLGFDHLDIYEIYSKAFAIRRNSIDEKLLRNILTEECYQPNLWFNRNLRDEFMFQNVGCILDIGANIGLATCYFSNLFKEACIYSFEVDEDNYELLKRNTEGYPNVKVFRTAIWNNNKGVYINNRNDIYGHSGKANPAKYTVGKEAVEREKKIDSIRVSDFITQMGIEKIDILKMDIQGSEIEAFEDSRLWLPYVRLLFIEIHDLFRDGCSKKVFGSLAEYGDFKFIGSPNGEILAFLREDEL